MKSITGAECTNLSNRDCKACCGCCLLLTPFVAPEVEAEPLLAILALGKGAMGPVTDAARDPKCFVIFCVRAAGSAPSTWSTTLRTCKNAFWEGQDWT